MNEATTPMNPIVCPTCSIPVEPDYLIPAGDQKICPNCRDEYYQRLSEGASTAGDGDADIIRQEHIKHEASVKSIGLLYYLGGGLMVFGGVSLAGASLFSEGGQGLMLGVLLIYGVLGVLSLLLGRGFRRLKRWVRIPSSILAGLGLLSFPVGTLINGYILYLMWSQKGKMVFSEEYQDVITATPEVKYRTPLSSWIVLFVIILLLVGLVAYFANAA